MGKIISVGNQSFESIREMGAFYIDKTNFIKEWWENGDIVTLVTRPRHNLQGSFPVLFISFAGIKADNYEMAREGIVNIIIDLYVKYSFLLQGGLLDSQEKEYFSFINHEMTDAAIALSLNRLALCMNHYYGKKVIILLDEYDTPLQEAYVYGYWDKMVLLVRTLFNYTFKTNPYLERGLMTGITRVSKESIFSDLNNLVVITTTSGQYAACFGFTEKEVFGALEEQGLGSWKDSVKKWYDGFIFGDEADIYNPWSVTSFLKEKKLKTYWANTSSNSLAGQLVREGTPEIKTAFEDLLAGGQVTVEMKKMIYTRFLLPIMK